METIKEEEVKKTTKNSNSRTPRGRSWSFLFRENEDHCIVVKAKATNKKDARQKAIDLLKTKGYTGVSAKLKDI